jgi:3-oxoadipate enol-lactonase
MTVRLAHDVHGDPTSPVLVLGSSLGTTRAMWEPQLSALADRFRVVRYEHRGHGRCPAPTGPYVIDDLGRDVLALLDELGVDRYSYAGVSLGGMVGMWLASTGDHRVERLALVCTSAATGNAAGWRERAAAVRAGGTAPIAGAVIGRWFEQAWADRNQAVVDRFTEDFVEHMDAEGYAGCCEALAGLDLRPRLAAITAATLVVAGADDLALPVEPHSRTIADAVAGARLEVVDRAAHLATVDRADVCTPLLLDHLGGGS